MEIKELISNNLKSVSCEIDNDKTYGIAGLSGSGKSTFCTEISDESIRRVVTLLPKSEYRFLFSDRLKSNYSAQNIKNLPLVFYLKKSGFTSNPRSTIGTHTGVFKDIRNFFAEKYDKTSDFFSFNTSIMWCEKCKGRGSSSGKICMECNGNRYSKKIDKYIIDINRVEYNIAQVNEMSIIDIIKNSEVLGLSSSKIQLLRNIVELDIGYLSLDRIMSTLSGGETVRVLLAEFMAECQNSLIIIDELSIGLDHNTLVDVMKKVSKLGKNNQIWLIDHSETVLNATEKRIFFGPGSGKDGGNIIENSSRPDPEYYYINEEKIKHYYEFNDLKKRNLDIKKLIIPKNRIIAITGESGCGKSTLVKDCIFPAILKKYKKVVCDIIGQDRNQSITSKSNLATFLDIKKKVDKYSENIISMDIIDILSIVKKDKNIYYKINMLVELGLGYLSLDRKVQSLSTGEFQCLHLVSKLTNNIDDEMILIFDEPSKGLSQNILNLLMAMMKKIVLDFNKTILIIEHNDYMLRCSDYILDFGKRTTGKVNSLEIISNKIWIDEYEKNKIEYQEKIKSKIPNEVCGIEKIDDNIENLYNEYENIFKGGLLKNFSQTAQWIYGDYETDKIIPIISIDLEKMLYSKNTFLFEIGGLINSIIKKADVCDSKLFDFYSINNLCKPCKGTGKLLTIDFDKIVNDNSKGLWDGLLYDDVMTALKKYNYSKIKFLFKELKKSIRVDLEKPYNKMSEYEKNIFLYGYWEESFYDKSKKTQRKWKGIIHLIIKYMRSSTSKYKGIINDSKKIITCPICKGTVLKHDKKLIVFNKDIRNIISSRISENIEVLKDIPQIDDIIKICGSNLELNFDVSELSQEEQVQLKMTDLKYASIYGYKIVLKNYAPFKSLIENTIEIISKNNRIVLMDYQGINNTKKDILNMHFSKGKIKETSYVYELFEYKKINVEINKIRKKFPCVYCKGSKVIREESIFEGVDITEIPCLDCNKTGISEEGLKKQLNYFSVKTWLLGTLKDLKKDIKHSLSDIPLVVKVADLNKKQIIELANFIKE